MDSRCLISRMKVLALCAVASSRQVQVEWQALSMLPVMGVR